MAAYEVKQRFYEIGSRQGLAELDSLLRDKAATILMMSYSEEHLRETAEIVAKLDPALCEKAVELLGGCPRAWRPAFYSRSRRQCGKRISCRE